MATTVDAAPTSDKNGYFGAKSIYLAGPFAPHGDSDDWRDIVKERLGPAEFHDPRMDTDQLSSGTFSLGDLEGVGRAQLVVGYNPKGNYDVDPYGLCVELGYAFAKRIPIIYCDENDWIFPMIPPLTRRLFTSFELMTDYLEQLFIVPTEFHAFYAAVRPG